MAKPQLTLSELTKSLKSQSAGMDEQQLKRANATLEKLAAVSGDDNAKLDEIQKTNTQVKKSLSKDGDINKSLQEMIKFYKTSNKEILKHNKDLLKKVDNLQKPQDRTKLGDIKYEKPLTFRESLKEGVAGTKSFFSKAGGIGSGVFNALRNPGQTINKAIGKAQDKFYGGIDNLVDIASTDKNYTPEAGRFGETYAKTEEGKKFGDKAQKMGEVGYNQLKAKEKEIADVESKIKEMKSQGFDPNKGDVDQLKSLKQQRSELDIRNPSQINAPISPTIKPEEKSQYAKVDSNQIPGFLKPLGNIGDKNEAGKSINAQALNSNNSAEASAISKEESFLKQNPEGDNIQSANEKMADSLKELSLTSKDILIATRESVDILKSINKDLLGDNVQPLRTKEQGAGGGAPAEAAAAASPGLLDTGMDLLGDFLGRDKGKPKGFPRGTTKVPSPIGKPSLGGRILGGVKGIAKSGIGKLGGALAIAGGAYSAYTGVSNASDEEKAKLAQIEEAKASGEITEEEAKKLTNETKDATVEKKGGAVGGGIGSAIGGMIGGTLGAVGGSFLMPGVGTVVGGVAGGAAGAAAGEAAGNWIGEKAGKVANFFGGSKQAEAKPTETVAGKKSNQISEKDLFGGLTKEQYQFAIQKVNGKYKNEMTDENGKEITDEKKRIEAMKKGVGQLQDLTDAAGKKDVTAKMDDSQVGAMQPAASEGQLSSDPQMDQDIKANQKRVANVTPTKPSPKSGELSNSSLEYTDLDRERSQSKPSPAPVIMNNSSNNATTKIMPMKADPRPNSRGSPLDKYLERTSTFN